METTAKCQPQTELLVCVKCRRGQEIPSDARRPGQALYDDLTGLDRPEGVRITAVECLQNCDHGCTVALRVAMRNGRMCSGMSTRRPIQR